MISQNLINQVHGCADKLTTDLVGALQTSPECPAYRSVPRDRLITLKDDLYKNLGRWLRSRSKAAVQSRYVRLGRERYLEGIPLSQLIFALNLTKSMLLNFIRRSVQGQAGELNLEYELVLSITEFFDEAIYFASMGYEDACRAHLSAPPAIETATEPSVRRRRPQPAPLEAAELDLPISRAGDIGEASG